MPEVPLHLTSGFFAVKDQNAWKSYVAANGASNPVTRTVAFAGNRMDALLSAGRPMLSAVLDGLSGTIKEMGEWREGISDLNFNCIIHALWRHWQKGAEFGAVIKDPSVQRQVLNMAGEPDDALDPCS